MNLTDAQWKVLKLQIGPDDCSETGPTAAAQQPSGAHPQRCSRTPPTNFTVLEVKTFTSTWDLFGYGHIDRVATSTERTCGEAAS
jgi:hypothetical protein